MHEGKMETARDIARVLEYDGCYCCRVTDTREYHAMKKELEERMKLPVVSKSSLLDFMEDPYAYHWRQVSGEEVKSEALRKGSLIDCLTLTPEAAGDLYVVGKADRRTKAGKELAAQVEAEGKELVTQVEYEAALRTASLAQRELEGRLGEYKTQVAAYFVTDEVRGEKLATPVIVTGMFDVLPEDGGLPIVDLKTTSRNIVSEREVNRNMAEFGYGVQAAMYVDLALFGMGESRKFMFFYVTVSEPTRMRFVDVNMTDIELYRARYFDGLKAYAAAWNGDDWGSALLPDMVYEVPSWDAKRGIFDVPCTDVPCKRSRKEANNE